MVPAVDADQRASSTRLPHIEKYVLAIVFVALR
jgi:hypothetical protein